MKRFYLAGQNNFGNRGCEALVRSTIELLKAEFGEVEVMVPSYRPDLDSRQWPEAQRSGCRFVRADPYPDKFRTWGRGSRVLPFLKHFYLPDYEIPKDVLSDVASCDALLLIGGDNITLDYGIESLLWHIRFAQHAQRLGKKVMIWGASVGPFTSELVVERLAADFLRSVDCITVRETISLKYLHAIGVAKNVRLVTDSAFVMTPQPVDMSTFWPTRNGKTIVGFNMSPLIQKFRPKGEARQVLQREVAEFLKETTQQDSVSIVLLPHVDPLDGRSENSDSHYMREILEMTGNCNGSVSMVPSTLNAAQLKYILSQCTYFIGARTHATIGALSCMVPTISVAYSTKAKGLNRDLFGNEDLVLETSQVSKSSLKHYYYRLTEKREEIVATLTLRIPEWREKATLSPKSLAGLIAECPPVL
jgi:colanic acid/amylovoran biosynthesis protein